VLSPKAIYRGAVIVNDENNFVQVPLVKDVLLQLVDIKSSAKDDFIPAIVKFTLELASGPVTSVPETAPAVFNRTDSQRSVTMDISKRAKEEEESEDESENSSDSSSLPPPPPPSTPSTISNTITSKKPSLEKLASFHEFLESGLVDEDDSNQEEESESEESDDSVIFPVRTETKGNESLQSKPSLDKSTILHQFLRQGSIDEDNSQSENDENDESIDDDSLEKEMKAKSFESVPTLPVDKAAMMQTFIREGSMEEDSSESVEDSFDSTSSKHEEPDVAEEKSVMQDPTVFSPFGGNSIISDNDGDGDTEDSEIEEEENSFEKPLTAAEVPLPDTAGTQFKLHVDEENNEVRATEVMNKGESEEEIEESLDREEHDVNDDRIEVLTSSAFDNVVTDERRGSVFDMADIYNTDIMHYSQMNADDMILAINPNEKLFEMPNPLLVEDESSESSGASSDEGQTNETLSDHILANDPPGSSYLAIDATPLLTMEEQRNGKLDVIENDKEQDLEDDIHSSKESTPLHVDYSEFIRPMNNLQTGVIEVSSPFFVIEETADEDVDEEHGSEVSPAPVTIPNETLFVAESAAVLPQPYPEGEHSSLQSETDESPMAEQVAQLLNENHVEANPFFLLNESEDEDEEEETDDVSSQPPLKSAEIDEYFAPDEKDYEKKEQETTPQSSHLQKEVTSDEIFSSVANCNETTKPLVVLHNSVDEHSVRDIEASFPVWVGDSYVASMKVHDQGSLGEIPLLLSNDGYTGDVSLSKAEGHLADVDKTQEEELSLGTVSSEVGEVLNPFLVLSDDMSDQEIIPFTADAAVVNDNKESTFDLVDIKTTDDVVYSTVFADDILETLRPVEKVFEVSNPLLTAIVDESPVPSAVSSDESEGEEDSFHEAEKNFQLLERSNEPQAASFQPSSVEQRRSSLALLFSESFLLPFEETIPSVATDGDHNRNMKDDDTEDSADESVGVYADEESAEKSESFPPNSISDPLLQHVQDLSIKVQLLLEENERQKEALRALQQGKSVKSEDAKAVHFAEDIVLNEMDEPESVSNLLESPKRRSTLKGSMPMEVTARRTSNAYQTSRPSMSGYKQELESTTGDNRQSVDLGVQVHDTSHVRGPPSTFIDLSKPLSLVEKFFNNVKTHQEEEEAEGIHHYEDEDLRPKRKIHLGSAIATPIRLMTRRRGIYDQNAASILSNIIAPVNISPDSSRNATPVALTSSQTPFFPAAPSSPQSSQNSFVALPSSQPLQFDLKEVMSRRNEMITFSSVADVTKPVEAQIQQQLMISAKTPENDFAVPASSVVPIEPPDAFPRLPPAAVPSSMIASPSSSAAPSVPKVNKLKKFDTSALQNMFAKRSGGDDVDAEKNEDISTDPVPENILFSALPNQQAPVVSKAPVHVVAVKEKKPMDVFYSGLFTVLLDGIRPGMMKAVSLLESSIALYNSTSAANDKPRWNSNISAASGDGNRRRTSVVASTSSNNLIASASNDGAVLVNPTPRRSSLSIDSTDMTTYQQQRNNSSSPNTIASTSGRRSSSVFQSRRGSAALSSSASFPLLPSIYDDLISFFATVSDCNRIDDSSFQKKIQLSFSQNLKINDFSNFEKHVLTLSDGFHDWKKNNDPSSRYSSGEVNWEISDLFHSARVLVSLLYYSTDSIHTTSSVSSFPSKQLPFSPSKSFDANDSFKSIDVLRKLNALQDNLIKFLPIVSKNAYAPTKASLSSQASSLLQSCEVLLAQFSIFSSLKNLALMEIMLRLAVLQESLLRQKIFFKSMGNRDLAKYCKKLGNAVSVQLQLEKELLDLQSHDGVVIPGSPIIRSPQHDPSPPSADKLKSTAVNLFPDSPPSSGTALPKKRPSSVFYSEIAKHLHTPAAIIGDGKYCLEKIRWIIGKAEEVYHRYCVYKETLQTVTLLDAHDDTSSSSDESGDSDDESFSESKQEKFSPVRRQSQSRSPFSAASHASRRGKAPVSMASLGNEIQFFASKVKDHKFQKSREKQKEYRLVTVIEQLLAFKEEMNKKITQLTTVISIEQTDEFILSLSCHNPVLLSNKCYEIIYQGDKEKAGASTEWNLPTLLIQLQSKKLLHSIYETWPSLTFTVPTEKPAVDTSFDTSKVVENVPFSGSLHKKKTGQNVSFSSSISSSSSTMKSEPSVSVLRTALRAKSYNNNPNEETKQQPQSRQQQTNTKQRQRLSISSSTNSLMTSLPSPTVLPPATDSTFTLSMLSPGGVSTSSPQNVLSFNNQELHAASSFLTDLNEESLEIIGAKHIDLSSLDFSNTKTLRKVGFTLCQLRDSGCYSWNSLLFAGFPLSELKHLRLLDATSFELVMSELRNAGYSIEQCHRAGFGLKALKVAGYTEMELIECGLFTPKQLASIGLDIQRFVLKVFYESMDGKYWKHNDNWLSPLPLSSWYGIKVDPNRTIISIDLRSNHLTGNLPECLSFLSSLQYLDLYNNDIVGSIPASYARLTKLKDLWLDGNPELGRTMTKPQLQKLLPNCRVRI
jgi:hypothetical protein